jgi:hypothetical protein
MTLRRWPAVSFTIGRNASRLVSIAYMVRSIARATRTRLVTVTVLLSPDQV